MMKHFTTVPRSIAVDITETEQQYIVTGDVPGCEKDDVDVELDDDNILAISVKKESKVEEDLAPESAEDSEAKEDKDVSAAGEDSAEKESIAKTTYPIFHRIERRTEFQSRSLKLPSNIVHDSMAAKLDNGILTISVDKVVPITKKRRITIQKTRLCCVSRPWRASSVHVRPQRRSWRASRRRWSRMR